MTIKVLTTDHPITHVTKDAHPGQNDDVEGTPAPDRHRELIIQPDLHGLTVQFPNGEIIAIDLSQDYFSVYKFDDETQANPTCLYKVKASNPTPAPMPLLCSCGEGDCDPGYLMCPECIKADEEDQ